MCFAALHDVSHRKDLDYTTMHAVFTLPLDWSGSQPLYENKQETGQYLPHVYLITLDYPLLAGFTTVYTEAIMTKPVLATYYVTRVCSL